MTWHTIHGETSAKAACRTNARKLDPPKTLPNTVSEWLPVMMRVITAEEANKELFELSKEAGLYRT